MGRYALANDGFSVAGLLNQADEINKTAGSYYIVGGFRHYKFSSEASLIPASLQGTNLEMDSLRKLSNYTANLGVGAGKYWVSKSKFFIGAVLDISGTYGQYKYELTTSEQNSSYGTLSHSLKVGAGYAGKKWRSGLSAYADATTLIGLNSTYIKPQATAFFIYVRYVFD